MNRRKWFQNELAKALLVLLILTALHFAVMSVGGDSGMLSASLMER